jgi:hypothetical protein
MRRKVVGAVLFLGALGAIACGKGGAKVSALKDEGFSRTCATDDDCVLATFGDTCGMCTGSNAAIAKSAQASWQRAYNTARANCPADNRVGKCSPSYGVSHCDEGKVCRYVACAESPVDEHHCTSASAHARTDVKDTFSHACATDDDCALVFFGGACGICNESNGAIAKKDRDAYQKAYNAARANCPPEHVVGECAVSYGVSRCSAAKTCTYASCPSPPKDEHHCTTAAN